MDEKQRQDWPPTFCLPQDARRPNETDAQWASYRQDQARYAQALGLYLGLFQLLATELGRPRACGEGRCRRLRRCVGRRASDDWSFFLRPLIPPCVPLDPEVVEAMRAEIRAEVARRAPP